jgi:hypothetical protein
VIAGRIILRADFRGASCQWKRAARQPGTSVSEAFTAALSLGEPITGTLWLLCDEWFSQRLQLNPAQVAGLNEAQMTRALAFEAEPFSGIPMAGAALAFRSAGSGAFDVVTLPAETRDRLLGEAAVRACGLHGIASADAPPEDEDALHAWLGGWLQRLNAGQVPVVGAPTPPPSPQRFKIAGLCMAATALLLLLGGRWWLNNSISNLKTRNAEFSTAAGELAAVNRNIQDAAKEIDTLRSEIESVNSVASRRLSVPALLNGIAVQRKDEIVLRKIETDGTSTSILRGVSLTSDAVDELGIVLKESLRGSGWSVFQGGKTGLKKLANGGPWDFSLRIIHQEASREGVNLNSSEDNR